MDIGYISAMPLLLLHGAIGSSEQLTPMFYELMDSGYQPHLFDFPGHGGQPFPETGFSIEGCATEVIRYMDFHSIPSADVFGYSMGGYVGLYLARHYPERVNRIATVATKLEWTPAIAEKEVKMLNPEKIQEKVPKFAKMLEDRHSPEDWKRVLHETAKMMVNIGANPPLRDEDFRIINQKVVLCVGDGDTMVSQEETKYVADLIPNSEMKMLADTPHPIEQMNIQLLVETAVQFFK